MTVMRLTEGSMARRLPQANGSNPYSATGVADRTSRAEKLKLPESGAPIGALFLSCSNSLTGSVLLQRKD